MADEDWRGETASDLAEAEEKVLEVLGKLTGEPTKAQVDSVWLAYVRVEKSIFFIRVEIDEENPGRRIKLRAYSVPDERQALQFALRNLRLGAKCFAAGDYLGALRGLRESRNYLRALLREKTLRERRGS